MHRDCYIERLYIVLPQPWGENTVNVSDPSPPLFCFQILFTITFWLLLRQHLTEQKALREKEALLSEVKIGSQELEERGKWGPGVMAWHWLLF